MKNDELSDLIPPFDQEGMDLRLNRMQMALKAMGSPCAEIPAIQIVGTNGKGSIASFIQSCLRSAGIKAGVTTSPHLVSWCERIQIDGNQISIEEFRQRLNSLQTLAKKHRLTPFELIMATAFDHFSEHNVEILVLEVGLGGRLDATTAHPFRPIIAMANIGLDHCEHLGHDLKDIAQEKAAVISPGSKVISSTQHPDVTQILKKTIKEQQADIHWVTTSPKQWDLGIGGQIQRKNAAVAIGALQAIEMLGWKLEEKTIREGLAIAHWPGRHQMVNWHGFPLLMDGAHNPQAAEKLSIERSNWDNQQMGVHWIIGIQKNKAAPTMLRHLLKPFDIAWIVPVPSHKSWTKLQLTEACPELEEQLLEASDIEPILKKISTKGQWPTPAPVITGSLYLIGCLLARDIVKID